ncbi:MAG TPA: esterase family protein [Clostridiaceae bacterium]|nr:esterase family protein [Clostridiaceae bacterium]
MAFIDMRLHSNTLKKAEEVYMVMPENAAGKVPVLYLLHGLSDDCSIWMRRTSIERYVREMELAVVMPNGGRSFYTDMQNGENYFTYIKDELPTKLSSMFNISQKREDTYIAGLSMGGYGAFKLALSDPGKFSLAASLSGAVDIVSISNRFSAYNEEGKREFEVMFGDMNNLSGSKHDLFYLLEKNINQGVQLPYLYQCCGTEDYLYQDNIKFRDFAVSKGVQLDYEEGPGEHSWDFWDKWIQNVLERIKKLHK